MADNQALQRAVDKNYKAFQKLLLDLMASNVGKYALMRNGKMVEIFDSARDAMIYGQNEYSDGLFSVQKVITKVVDLGYFSHAVHYKGV